LALANFIETAGYAFEKDIFLEASNSSAPLAHKYFSSAEHIQENTLAVSQ